MNAIHASSLAVLFYNLLGLTFDLAISKQTNVRPMFGALAMAASIMYLTFNNTNIFVQPPEISFLLNVRIVIASSTAVFCAHRFIWFCRDNIASLTFANLVDFIYESTSPPDIYFLDKHDHSPENAISNVCPSKSSSREIECSTFTISHTNAIQLHTTVHFVVAFLGLCIMSLGLLCHFQENAESYR